VDDPDTLSDGVQHRSLTSAVLVPLGTPVFIET
jgi:hypothetical protein